MDSDNYSIIARNEAKYEHDMTRTWHTDNDLIDVDKPFL